MIFNHLRFSAAGEEIIAAYSADSIECSGDLVVFKRNLFAQDSSGYINTAQAMGQVAVAAVRLRPGEFVAEAQ